MGNTREKSAEKQSATPIATQHLLYEGSYKLEKCDEKGNVRLTVYGSHSFIFSERTVFAAEAINEIVAPTGVKAFLVLIPLVLVLVLLFKK